MNESGQFLLAKQVLTPYVQYFVAVVPEIRFTRIRPKARLMPRETAVHYAVYLRQCGEDVVLVFQCKQVSAARLSAPIAVKTQTQERGSMFTRLKKFLAVVVCSMLIFAAVPANAAVVSTGPVSVAVSLGPVSESLTITVSSGTLAIPATGFGPSNASPLLTVTTSGQLAAGHSSVSTFAQFSGGATVLTNGTQTVSNANMFAVVNGGAGVAFTSVIDTVAQSVLLGTANTPPAGAYSQVDTISLYINSTAYNALVPNTTYTGTLNFYANAL